MDLINLLKKNLIKIGIVFGVLIFIIVIAAMLLGNKVHVSKSDSYIQIEKKLIGAAKIYAGDNKSVLPEMNKEKRLKIDTLVLNKYINEIQSKKTSKPCSGYVSITKESEDEYTYKPHLDCGKEYVTTSIADKIINSSVNNKGGLYEVNGKFVFKGDEPNNYLSIGKTVYRILSINEDKELKVIAAESTENFTTWDDRYNSLVGNNFGINDFNRSRLKEFLEKEYKSSTFPKGVKKYIEPKPLCIGKRSNSDDSNLTDEMECAVLSDTLPIGILQLSEFYGGSLDEECKSVQDKSCMNYNYLVEVNKDSVTITASKDDTSEIYTVYYGRARKEHAYKSFRPNLTFHLKSDTLYTNGNGTKSNPYTIRIY